MRVLVGFGMKLLTDFDGVLTNLEHEARRVRECFEEGLRAAGGPLASEITSRAVSEMEREPHNHGWHSQGRISAFCNEDGFIHVNALADCLDHWNNRGQREVTSVLEGLETAGLSSFHALAQQSFQKVMAETAKGTGPSPLDPSTGDVLSTLLKQGVEIVVVSNSGTERILQILKAAGLSPVGHGQGEGQLRVRGNAGKFVLGREPRTFSAGPYRVETDRPGYEAILLEEKPDVVVGDVFSLDLALPLELARTREGLRGLTAILRKREYTPAWSIEHLMTGLGTEVKRGVIDELDSLLELA